LRAGPENSGKPRRLAFQVQESNPTASASSPSASQICSHPKPDDWLTAIHEVQNAVTPMTMYPQPETAVNAAERSMVSRMKRRSSAGLDAESESMDSKPAEETVNGDVERRNRRIR
jgi:hypothetical protein